MDTDKLDNEDQEEYLKILKQLEDNAQIEELEKQEGWKIFDKAWKQIAAVANRKLASVNPDNKLDIIKLQSHVRFYENVIPETKNIIRKMAKNSYEFAEDKGWLHELGSFLTQRKFKK